MNLRDELLVTFASHPHPGKEQIVYAGVATSSGEPLAEALAELNAQQVTVADVRGAFEGNLWMLTPEAVLHYLPALMDLALNGYASVSVFASELIGQLTLPSREDVVTALKRFEATTAALGQDAQTARQAEAQQLEWFDSGRPTATFRERFTHLSPTEGTAVLTFLEAFRDRLGDHFPFGELDTAIDRYWVRFRPKQN